jgi:hypothetical protein
MAWSTSPSTYVSSGATAGYTALNLRSLNYRLTDIDGMGNARQKYLSQRWAFTLESPPIARGEAFEVMASFTSAKGRGTRTVLPPIISNTSGTASGTVTASLTSSISPNFNYVKGSTAVGVTGGSGTIKKGDFIKFSNHTKVYMVTADVNLDGSTLDTIGIFPALFQDLTSGTTVAYNNILFTVSFQDDGMEIETDQDGRYRFAIDLKEEF